MWPDNDEPGERLFLQLKEVLPNLGHHQQIERHPQGSSALWESLRL